MHSLERSYIHRGGETPLIGETIDGFFRAVVLSHPDNEAIVSLDQNARLTYREFDDVVRDLAKGLVGLGVKKGDRVGIWSTDNIEWVVVQMATARIGAVLVNVNPAYRPAELEHALKLARVQTLFLIPSFKSSHYAEMICNLCPEARISPPGVFASTRLPDLQNLVVYQPDRRESTGRPGNAFLTWNDVIAYGEPVSDDRLAERSRSLDPDDPINIQFTSGTTGFPKAVVLTHHNILNNAWFAGEILGFTSRDRLCVPLPFYHCFGMVVSNLLCLTRGATLVIPSPHFEAGATLAAIQNERCTALHGVPTMFIAELECPDFADHDLSSLRTGIMAGAPCPPELVRKVVEDMGCREFLIGYGQTEASPITHLTRRDDSFERRVDSVGTNLPHQEVKIIDPQNGSTLPIGERGEICFRGYHVMRGYFDQAEATRETIDEAGWLHSGDLGVMDKDGYVRITGRLKNMIIRGGENIYPAEIEAFYYEHPKIAEVAVFGVPDERLGEEVAAWIKLHDGETATAQELQEWAVDRIAYFKVPKHISIVDEFPMTVTGKIQKFKMREITAEQFRHRESAPAIA